MVTFELAKNEKEIFKFRIIPIKSPDSSLIGELLITNFHVWFKPIHSTKANKNSEFKVPLSEMRIKYKKKGIKRQHIIVNHRKLSIDIFDNKLVSKWLNSLIKKAKKHSGEPIPLPHSEPKFIKALEKTQAHMATYIPPDILYSAAYSWNQPKTKRKTPLNESHTINESMVINIEKKTDNLVNTSKAKKCPHCSATIAHTAKFCIHCGKQIA